MKEIYLRVQVPDDFDLPVTSVIFEKDNMYFRDEKYVTEIHLPTEEEIYTASKDEDILHPLNTPKPAFRIGANWYESKIKSR